MQQPKKTMIIIMGATGDLATKNLIPALYELFTARPELTFSLIGIAHNSINASQLLQKVRPFLSSFQETAWNDFMEHTHFITGDMTQQGCYTALAALISTIEQGNQENRLVYCACPPQLFIAVARSCVAHKILVKQDSSSETNGRRAWHKIVFEKPFGTNRPTAQALNHELTTLFSEAQIIRADHYLAKELVETLAYVRFTNEIFEPLWNTDHIAYVLITMHETTTVEQRADLYDTLGVIRDVIQSHALQLLSLVAMEPPTLLQGRQLHQAKSELLKKTTITQAIFGQYHGYTAHTGVKPGSTTPTYALITVQIDTPRWQDVPFVIQAGKALSNQETSIRIVFKLPTCRLARGCPLFRNELTITLAPRGEFNLAITLKTPEKNNSFMPINLNFCYSCMWPYTPQAYRVIFENILADVGDSISVPFSEIEQSWQIVDPIITQQTDDQLFVYQLGSSGPQQATEYLDALRTKKNYENNGEDV